LVAGDGQFVTPITINRVFRETTILVRQQNEVLHTQPARLRYIEANTELLNAAFFVEKNFDKICAD